MRGDSEAEGLVGGRRVVFGLVGRGIAVAAACLLLFLCAIAGCFVWMLHELDDQGRSHRMTPSEVDQHEAAYRDKGSAEPDVRVVQFDSDHAVFNRPIPDEFWPRASQIAREEANTLGAVEESAGDGEAGERHTWFESEEGLRITLLESSGASRKEAGWLDGAAPCRLPESWYEDRRIPAPSPPSG